MYVEKGGFLVFLPATFGHLIKIWLMGYKQKCCAVFLGCFPNRKRAHPYPCTSFFLLPIKWFCLLEFWIFWMILEKVNKDFSPNELEPGGFIQQAVRTPEEAATVTASNNTLQNCQKKKKKPFWYTWDYSISTQHMDLGLSIQPMPMPKWQTEDKPFSLRKACISLTLAFEVGDSLHQGRCIGVSTQTFKLMVLSYSLRVNQQKPDYFVLDHVLQDTTFNITASLCFFSQRKTWEKN